MSAPALIAIEVAIREAIASIRAGLSSYNNTVDAGSISMEARDLASIPKSAMPAVDVVFQGEEPLEQPGLIRQTARYLITGHVGVDATEAVPASIERREKTAKLKDDIKAALYGSEDLNGSIASFVKLAEYIDNSGVGTRDAGGAKGAMSSMLSVIYYETRGLTT